MRKLRVVTLAVTAITLCLALSSISADAALTPATARLTRVVGRVEVLRKGQAVWAPAQVGTQLAESDQIRSGSGASADLAAPDGSTILIAENTRFVVTRLAYDSQSRERDAGFHLVVGKIRAQVTRLAVQVARGRQSNFYISTPSGVAAVRGTVVVIAFNPATNQTFVAAFPSPGQSAGAAVVNYISLSAVGGAGVIALTGGQFVTQIGTGAVSAPSNVTTLPPGVQQALQTAANSATANSDQLTVVTIVLPPIPPIIVAPPPSPVAGVQLPPAISSQAAGTTTGPNP